jgi:hypothetical protein
MAVTTDKTRTDERITARPQPTRSTRSLAYAALGAALAVIALVAGSLLLIGNDEPVEPTPAQVSADMRAFDRAIERHSTVQAIQEARQQPTADMRAFDRATARHLQDEAARNATQEVTADQRAFDNAIRRHLQLLTSHSTFGESTADMRAFSNAIERRLHLMD